jgi:predicted nucleotidyltransferase
MDEAGPCIADSRKPGLKPSSRRLRRSSPSRKQHTDVVAIYAFGSVAEDRVGPDSDLVLLVVRETTLVGPERGTDLVVAAKLDVACDLVVVAPQEFCERSPCTSFGRTILKAARRVDAA